MIYISTRGDAPEATFEDVLLKGLAPDGGLYMPLSWPEQEPLPSGIESYAEAAAKIMAPFVGDDVSYAELRSLTTEAYAGFTHDQTAPLIPLGNDIHLLELFHGPTLAFKDFAMQVLSRLMERALAKRNGRMTILGATSGDTGAAAIEAFRGRKDIEVFILFPQGRVSDVQRRQMTTAIEDNVHAVAVEGTFDDCQAHVKTLFGDKTFRERYSLSAINSINWARIMAQTVYYFTAIRMLRRNDAVFSVPTGNFGDIFAGYVASRMGLPLSKLVIATNENDILARTLLTGRYEPKNVLPTDSPSMDIQVSSNFERLLFEASNRDAAQVRSLMASLQSKGFFDIYRNALDVIRAQFSAHRVSRSEAAYAMKQIWDENGLLIDPHTAVGVAAAQKQRRQQGEPRPTIVLATAHPAKFPDAVAKATGQVPDVPPLLHRCLESEERYSVVPNTPAAVADFIKTRSVASASFLS